MTALNKQALRSKSRSASSGEWIKESGDGWEAICSSDDEVNGNFIIAHLEGPDAKENREFIQAANPDIILALLDELEAAQKSNEFLKEQLAQLASFNPDWDKLEAATDSIREHMVELISARNRIAELEARDVNLPKRSVGEVMHMSGFSRDYAEGWCAGNDNAIHEIRAAGIGVKEE